ncbi:MAG: hypothetical protein ACLTDS_15200 [Bianqueaceae bacterium]
MENNINDSKNPKSLQAKNEKIKRKSQKILESIKTYPYLWGQRIVIFLILIPCIILFLYFLGDHGLILINTSLGVGDALGFYGTLLSFAGTIALGVLALYQNVKANQINERLLSLEEKRSTSFLIPNGKLEIEFYEKPYLTDFFQHTFMADISFPLKNFFGNIIQTFQISSPILILKTSDNSYRWKQVGLIYGIQPKRIYLPNTKASHFHLAIPNKSELDPRELDSFEVVLSYKFESKSIYNDVFNGTCMIHSDVYRDKSNQSKYIGNITIDTLSYQPLNSPIT